MDVVANASAGYLKEAPPDFEIGDTVDVKVRIQEGDKERIQTFTGVVIRVKGCGISTTFTVRRTVQGEGVERVFPLHSPFVVGVITKKKAKVRRAKLYDLRGRTGQRGRMKERHDYTRGTARAQRAKAVKRKPVKPEAPEATEEAEQPAAT